MLLYHGSNTDIKSISLAMCRPYKDFGKGFYLTELKEQAAKMAARVSKIYGGIPIINVYEITDGFSENTTLNILRFADVPSKEWARFVMNNRSRSFTDHASAECNHDNKYDIVIGPVADDDMAMLFRQYQNELITFENLINGMTFRKTTNQYSFHTERAISLLRKVGAEK
ncbi:DUF3990 domain-containing protein [Ruminococcus flavefaciens]|uniref:DUF3990 domain-containing protein n=1 Tax=Ruminococcus flavefaciens TaxID=1265 RepID=A0A1K1MH94_RUMFL|nr:DUF3990 domain-containing protein [Ruminococcus flavefaciens]SFW22509.1 Protein of unknown function [Ruminococcus flavefaciens]